MPKSQKVGPNARVAQKLPSTKTKLSVHTTGTQCKITQSTGMATQMQLEVFFGGKSHGHPGLVKQTQERRLKNNNDRDQVL